LRESRDRAQQRTGPIFSGGIFTTNERFESNLTAIDPATFAIKAGGADTRPQLEERSLGEAPI